MERTFVMIKPDGIERKLVGEIITRLEKLGLNLEEMKLVYPLEETVRKHYPASEEWLISAGKKAIASFKKYRLDIIEKLGTDNEIEIGRMVKNWLVTYLTSNRVIIMILSGNHAVEVLKRVVGDTVFAVPGTIRGDYCIDSPDLANSEKRVIYNVIHTSGSVEEAQREIALWFQL